MLKSSRFIWAGRVAGNSSPHPVRTTTSTMSALEIGRRSRRESRPGTSAGIADEPFRYIQHNAGLPYKRLDLERL